MGFWPSGVFPPAVGGGQLVNQFSLGFLVVALQPLCLCFRFAQLDFFPSCLLGTTSCMVLLLTLFRGITNI